MNCVISITTINIILVSFSSLQSSRTFSNSRPASITLHPVRNPRFASFRTQPLENLSAAVKLPIKKGFWATQPLEQILDSEFLLCELGVVLSNTCSRYTGISTSVYA